MKSHQLISDLPKSLQKEINNKQAYTPLFPSDVLMKGIIPNIEVQSKGKLRIACKFLLFSTLSCDPLLTTEFHRQKQPTVRLERICKKASRAIFDYRFSDKGGKTGEMRAYYYEEIISNEKVALKHKAVAIYALLKLEGGNVLKIAVKTAIAPYLANNKSSIEVVAATLMELIMNNEISSFSPQTISQLANQLLAFKDTPQILEALKELYRSQFLGDMAAVYTVDYACKKISDCMINMLNTFEKNQLNTPSRRQP